MTLMHPFYRCAVCFLLMAGLGGHAGAAELGDAIVRSHLGQPLVADIELNTLAEPGKAVVVRMAHADVYKGANIGMHPVLGNLTMSVMKRDGRQFLHITSLAPVNTENVHLFLDLTDGGRRNVRAVTLWLTPDPAPPPAPVVAPPPVAAAPAMVPKLQQTPPPAVAAPRPVRILTAPPVAPVCPQPQFSAEQIQACTVMDEKNAQLSAQIVELEAKVKLLQVAIEGKPVPAAPAKLAPPPPPKKKVRVEEGFPWGWLIGALALLALIGGGVWHFLKRRKASAVAPAVITGEAWHTRLLGRFKRKPKAAVAPPADPASP